MAKPLVDYAPVQLVQDEGSANFTPTVTQGTGISWTAYNLPTGASVNSGTGVITGTLSTPGRWITELIARNANFATGEADSGSTTAAVDSALSAMTFADDLYNKFILFTSGSNAGVLRKITRYDDSTKTITFDRSMPASVASGDDFEILGLDDFIAITVPWIVYSSVVTIDAAWLADSANQHDDGWKIEGGSVNNSHKIFRLDQDVTSTKTAFWIADEYVYLDLNGYTIHYGSANGSREYGVALYTKEFFTDTTYVGSAQTPEITNRTDPQYCAVFNGNIINDGSGDRTHALGCHRGYDLLVAETVVDTTGKDSCAINVYSSGHVYLLNNDFTCNLTDTFDRHAGPAIVQLNGTMTAENNCIKGQNSGFNCLSSSVARRNFISHAGEYTNGYAFFLYRTYRVEVYENVILPTNGRGILINGGSTPAAAYNSIVGNIGGHLETGNGEFGTALNPPFYRSRYNTNANVCGDNQTLGVGGGTFCGTSAIYLSTYGSDDGEEVIAGNSCDVISINRSDTDRYANSITFEGTGGATASSGGLVLIKDNTFRSNCYHIRVEGYDGFTQQATSPNGNTWETVDGDTALAAFFDAVDAKLLQLGMKSNVLTAAQTQRDVAYAIYDEIAGISGTLAAFWFVKYISHNGILSFCDITNSTFGTGVDPETYSYAYSTLSTGSARYRSGSTASIEVLHTLDGLPVENAELTVTTPQGDEYTITTDGDGVAEFTLYDFAIEKANASGSAFTVTDRTFSVVTQGDYSAIITHSSVPATITLEESPPTPPINTVAPVASGTPIVAETLSSTTGTWDNEPDTYAYQWYSNAINANTGGDAISGATSSTYDLTESELGLYVYCDVTAENVDGDATGPSNTLGPVLPEPTVDNPNVESYTTNRRTTASSSALSIDKPSGVVSGDVLILFVNLNDGVTPSCSGFTSITSRSDGGIGRTYAFYKDAGGSEGATYSITLNVSTTYINAGMIRVSGAISPATNAIEFASAASSANPSVSPTVTPSDASSLVLRSAATGRTNGTITATPTTQVFIDSVNGEAPHLAVSWEDKDNSASGTANFTQPNARECALITLALAPAPPPAPANTVAPAVIGIETQGETLATDNGTWTDADSYTYQWFRNASESTSGGTEISGATSTTYDLTGADVDKYIYCEVTATNITDSTAAFSNIVGPIAAAEGSGNPSGPVFSPVLSPINAPLKLLTALGLV